MISQEIKNKLTFIGNATLIIGLLGSFFSIANVDIAEAVAQANAKCGDKNTVDFDSSLGVSRVSGTDNQYVAMGDDGLGYLMGTNNRLIIGGQKVQLHGRYQNGILVEAKSWELTSGLPGGDGKTPPRAQGPISSGYTGLVCQ